MNSFSLHSILYICSGFLCYIRDPLPSLGSDGGLAFHYILLFAGDVIQHVSNFDGFSVTVTF